MSAPVSSGPAIGPDTLAISIPDGGQCMATHAGSAAVSAIGVELEDGSRAEFVSFCLGIRSMQQIGVYLSMTPDQARIFAAHLNSAADMVQGGLPNGSVQ